MDENKKASKVTVDYDIYFTSEKKGVVRVIMTESCACCGVKQSVNSKEVSISDILEIVPAYKKK